MLLFEESAQQKLITALGLIDSPLKVNNILTFIALICHPEGPRDKM